MPERFKLPTTEEVLAIAIAFNDDRNEGAERERVVNMTAMCQLILDRLYENGDIRIQCSKETPDNEQNVN